MSNNNKTRIQNLDTNAEPQLLINGQPVATFHGPLGQEFARRVIRLLENEQRKTITIQTERHERR